MNVDKRELLLGLVEGKRQEGYTPAAFFMHFPAEFHFGKAAVDKHEEFFRFTGMDLVKIQFELQFPSDPVSEPLEWEDIPIPELGQFEPQLEVVKGVVDRLGREAITVLTLYSPYMLAGQIGGHQELDRHLHESPVEPASAIRRIAERMTEFVRACADLGLDGFYHSTQGGESRRFKDCSVFENSIKPSDLIVMKTCEEVGRFNILHICDYHREQVGSYTDLTPFLDYPGHVVNTWNGHYSTTEISEMFGRPYMGGLDRLAPITPDAARLGLQQSPAILGADCTVPGSTPWENLRAAIEVAHGS